MPVAIPKHAGARKRSASGVLPTPMSIPSVAARPFADAAGRPYTYGGLGRCTVWLSGGRTVCSLADHGGMEAIAYFGTQALHRQTFFRATFRSAYSRVFRAQVLVDGRVYTLGVGDGQVHPSGWTGRMSIPEEILELDVALVCTNQSLIQAVRAVRNPRRHHLGLRLMLRDYTRVQAPRRTWSPWEKAASGAVVCSVEDVPEPRSDHSAELQAGQVWLTYPDDNEPRTTWIGIVGDGPVSMKAWRSQLRSFTVEEGGRDGIGIALIFAADSSDFRDQQRRLAKRTATTAWETVAQWAKQERTTPQPEGLPPVVASFAKQTPALLRGVMPSDLPGAHRSSYDSYWVWGWDSMFLSHVCLLADLDPSASDMLDLLARTADPKYGIGHSFDAQLRTKLTQLPSAQGLFAVSVWQQWAVAGDLEPARRHWEFITTWLKRCSALPRREGLLVGMSLFPDFPQDAGQNGNDLTPVMNGIFYQACRCIEQLAGALDDSATAAAAANAAEMCRTGIRRRLWDARRGFWYDSVDSITLRGRPSYPSHALFWITPFARELIHDPQAAASFMEKNHRFAGGIRMYPTWDPTFNADGNQLGQHYPPGQDPLYLRLMAMTGRQERLREWLGWLETFWTSLTVPEACTVEAENDGPHRPDNPGGRQMFTMKTWYEGLIGAILGISFDPAGLTIEPGLNAPLGWKGIPAHGRRWNINITGKGEYLSKLVVGGRSWTGTCKVPLPTTGTPRIDILRTSKPTRHPVLRSADGAEVLASEVVRGELHLRLRCSCRVLVRVWAPDKPVGFIAGTPIQVAWDAGAHIAEAWLPPSSNGVDVVVRTEKKTKAAPASRRTRVRS